MYSLDHGSQTERKLGSELSKHNRCDNEGGALIFIENKNDLMCHFMRITVEYLCDLFDFKIAWQS